MLTVHLLQTLLLLNVELEHGQEFLLYWLGLLRKLLAQQFYWGFLDELLAAILFLHQKALSSGPRFISCLFIWCLICFATFPLSSIFCKHFLINFIHINLSEILQLRWITNLKLSHHPPSLIFPLHKRSLFSLRSPNCTFQLMRVILSDFQSLGTTLLHLVKSLPIYLTYCIFNLFFSYWMQVQS